jgi:hypothetical protein
MTSLSTVPLAADAGARFGSRILAPLITALALLVGCGSGEAPPAEGSTASALGSLAGTVASEASGTTAGDGLQGLIDAGASFEYADGLGDHGATATDENGGLHVYIDEKYREDFSSTAAVLLHEGGHFGAAHPPEGQGFTWCHEADALCESLLGFKQVCEEWHPPKKAVSCAVIKRVAVEYSRLKTAACPTHDCTAGQATFSACGCSS